MSVEDDKKLCGIVMPISGIDGCSEAHWSDVLGILTDAIEDAGFEGNLVSNADDIGIIHKRIIHNLYENPIVVCDVSCKNPNVMFELGLRLAFDKPTIIVKDDKTSYSFDTSAIEHLEYPRDLRFNQIMEFKALLTKKIKATYEKSTKDGEYTTFLKHFGEFKVAKIDQKEVSGQEYIIDELKSLRRSINMLDMDGHHRKGYRNLRMHRDSDIDICLGDFSVSDLDEELHILRDHPALRSVDLVEISPDHYHLFAKVKSDHPASIVERDLEDHIKKICNHAIKSKNRKRSPSKK